uniref:Splicing factor Cactin n=1 Tax=Meloidogyne incognita TaxID=6306 RepID=A0A914N6Q4_MELIC
MSDYKKSSRRSSREKYDDRSISSLKSNRREERVKSPKIYERKRSRDKSVISTSSSDGSEFEKLLNKKRKETIQKEKEEKLRMKELETPDEKRARRIAKKLQKEERRRAEALKAFPEGIPYTDLNNPFNDTSLSETFVWKKKWETEGLSSVSKKKVEKINRETITKNLAEMEQLKKNREARDAAKEDMEMINRDQERRLCDWNRTEDAFHMKQARLRSSIRIKEGRAKPIDLLARYISYFDQTTEDDFQLDNPLSYIPKNSIDDLEDLIADINVYRMIDGKKNSEFWDDIETISKSISKKLVENRRRSSDSGTVHSSVREEVLKIFKGKSYSDLQHLQNQIKAKIKNTSKGTDVSYWEALLDQLGPYMAKQRLGENYAHIQQLWLKKIREEQMNEMDTLKDEILEKNLSTSNQFSSKDSETVWQSNTSMEELRREVEETRFVLPFSLEDFQKLEDEVKEHHFLQIDAKGHMKQFALKCYEYGRYSPTYGSESHIMPGIEILDGIEDAEKLQEARKRKKGERIEADLSASDKRMMDIAKQGMTEDEAVFAVEEALEKQHFLWSDKYRPRKPRYFNRVHTGFDWNKYNQTHYDIDNPPPKIVQGYRFNIFYPDLLDQTQTPSFALIKCEDSDFAILRFKAGPPYEDIGFKIVNREWEISYKHGYKCQFQNGVFQLWFFFKRYRYRR